MAVRRKRVRRSKRVESGFVFDSGEWQVSIGELKPVERGRRKGDHLFKYVAEKLPWDSLPAVGKYLKGLGVKREGVYMAHDSFGVARYGGRGRIFARLRSHKRKYTRELVYFSFYIIENKTHEREIENVILRAAGPQMVLNLRKVRDGIDPGRIGDYEPGTKFFRRRYARGTKRAAQLRRGTRRRS
jgi:hypothetical protein